MVIECTSSRSIRTESRSDDPSASESGTSTVVARTTVRRSSGHESSSCSIHAPAEIAAATTTPQAGHCSRARSCTLVAARYRATYPTKPTTASAAAIATRGAIAMSGRSPTITTASTALAT